MSYVMEKKLVAAILTVAQAIVYHKNTMAIPSDRSDSELVEGWFKEWVQATNRDDKLV